MTATRCRHLVARRRNVLTFYATPEESVEHFRRHRKPVAAFFIDLDPFKEIHDNFGHATGDAVLREVAQRLRSTMRDIDTVARLGREFVVIVGDLADPAHLPAIGRKPIDEITRPLIIDGHPLHMGASFGGSVFPRDGDSAAELLLKADVAMYHAKVSGGNRRPLFTADPGSNH